LMQNFDDTSQYIVIGEVAKKRVRALLYQFEETVIHPLASGRAAMGGS